MKKYLLILLIASVISACKKESVETPTNTATLHVSTFIEATPVQCDFYLLREENRDDVKNGLTLAKNGYNHSIIGFTAVGKVENSADVPPGDYILAVQIPTSNSNQSNWFRYSYKDIHLKAGDKVNTKMVFNSEGQDLYQVWKEN